MLNNELEASYSIEKLFRDVPELKYLPKAAAERGMYGSFINGTEKFYFVFGYDEDVIFRGDFYDIEGHLYLADEYDKEMRVHIHSPFVLRRTFNAYAMSRYDYPTYDGQAIIDCMNNLEQLTAICKALKVTPPEYFDFTPAFGILVRRYYKSIAQSGNQIRQKKLLDELRYQFYLCCLTSENPRPEDQGLSINDYRLSPYCVDKEPAKIEKAFRHPEKWEDHLFNYTKDYADNPSLVFDHVDAHIIDTVKQLFEAHHIPYRITNSEGKSQKFLQKLTELSVSRLGVPLESGVVIIYPDTYVLFAEYLFRWANIFSCFSRDDQLYAINLYNSGTFYGFPIPCDARLLIELKRKKVKFGASHMLQLGGISGRYTVYCIGDLSQKPLIDAIITNYMAEQVHTHSQSVAVFLAESEIRKPNWEGGHQVLFCEYGNEAGTFVGDIQRENGVYELSCYDSDDVLREKGVLVEEEVPSAEHQYPHWKIF